MKTIYQSTYFTIKFDDDFEIMKTSWVPESEEMSDEVLFNEINTAARLVTENKPRIYIADNTERKYVYSIHNQNKIATILGEACVEAGVSKFAVVRPKDMLVELSTEQTIDEARDYPVLLKEFDSLDEAIEWIK